jgi:ankyrin repeat protein
VSPNSTDIHKKTALHYAKGPEVIKYLISKGANVDARDAEGFTPLFTSYITGVNMPRFVFDRELSKVEALIAAGTNVNARDSKGRTPIFFYFNSPYIVRVLISAGADPNAKSKRGDTPLRYILKILSSPMMRSQRGTSRSIVETIEILMAATDAKPSNIGNIKISNLPANIRYIISRRAKEGTMRFMASAKVIGNLNPNMSRKILQMVF